MAKLNHQPFEQWLFSEEPLDSEQAQALQEHLKGCEYCQSLEGSWKGVEQLFNASIEAAPAPGFGARWQARLQEETRAHQRRQSLAMLTITAGIAAAIFLFMSFQLLEVLRSPDQLLLITVYRITSLIVYGEMAKEMLSSFLAPVIVAVPLLFWVGFTGIVSFLGVLWFVALRQLILPRRIHL